MKELKVNGKSLTKFAKKNGWIPCKNGCCLFDPSVPKEKRICMAEVPSSNLMPVGEEDIN